MSDVIVVDNLSKHFGPLLAVDGVSLVVRRGDVLGFLGPNGAGKTTTMRMITGFVEPSAGRVTIDGVDMHADPIAAKARIGYLPEGAPAYPEMTPLALLNFIADIRGLRGARKQERIARAVELVHLNTVLHRRIETLSKGFKRRVGLAQAILHDPEVLILDEPTDGLDPNQKHEVRELIREMAAQKAIIISTHVLEEVDAVCNRAAIIARGRLVFEGTPAELAAKSRYHNAVQISVEPQQAANLEKVLTGLAGVARVEPADGKAGAFLVLAKNGASILARVSDAAQSHGLSVRELHVEAGRLDEVFRRITQADNAAEVMRT
jgi:ABC-2 type transport system ATP-binding protein